MGLLWEAMRFRVRNIRRLHRLGVVTRSPWLRVVLALLDPIVPASVRTFAFDREAEAREWVRG